MERKTAFTVTGISALALVTMAALLSLTSAARAASPVAPLAAGEPALITVIGTGSVPGSNDFISAPQIVNLSIQVQDSDPARAIATAQAKLTAAREALVHAGIPAGAIHVVGLGVSRGYGVGPAEKAPQPPAGAPGSATGYVVGANLQVETADGGQLAAAFTVATQFAANVNAGFGKGGWSAPPDARTIAPAISAALENARAYAEALARASGKTLGALHSVSIGAPMPDCCPPMNGWRIQVTASYEIAP